MAEQPPQEELNAEVAGQKFSYKGMHLGNILQIIIVGAAVAAYFAFTTSAKSAKEDHDKLAKILEAQQKVLEKQLDAQVEFNYIITLDPDERKRLNLRMPESLRIKLRAFDR